MQWGNNNSSEEVSNHVSIILEFQIFFHFRYCRSIRTLVNSANEIAIQRPTLQVDIWATRGGKLSMFPLGLFWVESIQVDRELNWSYLDALAKSLLAWTSHMSYDIIRFDWPLLKATSFLSISQYGCHFELYEKITLHMKKKIKKKYKIIHA